MWNQSSFGMQGGGYQGYTSLQNPGQQQSDPESFYGYGGAPPGTALPGGAPPSPSHMMNPMMNPMASMMNPMASMITANTQAGMGQSANPGETRFWDRDYNWDRSFPEDLYQKTVEEKRKRDEALAEKVASMAPPHYESESESEETPIVEEFHNDPCVCKVRVFLFLAAILLAVLVVLQIMYARRCLGEKSFKIFDTLARESSFPGMSGLVMALGGIACLVMIVVALNICMGIVSNISVLRMNSICMIVLGLVLLCLTASSYYYGLRAEPDVIRTANLICQDTQVWGCDLVAWEAATTRTTTILTTTIDPGQTTAQLMPQLQPHRLFEEDLPSRSYAPRTLAEAVSIARDQAVGDATAGLRGALTSRRLATAANAAMAVLQSFMFPGETEDQVCNQIGQICVPPEGFNAAVACVCNGEWEIIPTTTTTTTTTVTSTTTTSSTTTVSTTTTTTSTRTSTTKTVTTTLDREEALRDVVDGLQGAGNRRLFDAPAPWNNTQGAYCEPWSAHRETPWCFVNADQECTKGVPVTYENLEGQTVTRSSGPCGDNVESRSAIVLEGPKATYTMLIASGVLGLVLVLLGLWGMQIGRSAKSAFRAEAKAHMSEREKEFEREKATRTKAQEARTLALEQESYAKLEARFNKAKALALTKVRETTPWHQKLALFGLFHQATEGDVHQVRPSFHDRRERSKYDAWARHRGMSQREAMERYIEAVNYIEANN